MNEYDARQLNLMNQKLQGFKAGSLYLSELIDDLEGLLNVLTFKDEGWKDSFSIYWMDLEQANAAAVCNGNGGLKPDSQKRVIEAVESLEIMVHSKLNDNIQN